MFDTIIPNLTKDKVGNVDFLELIPCFLNPDNIARHDTPKYGVGFTGYLGGLKISTNGFRVKISQGSLCKWYLGDNFNVMERGDVQRAFEKLSDTLHLPFDRATITRLDVANNIMTRHPVETYFSHFKAWGTAKPMIQPKGLYLKHANKTLVFYDKIMERKKTKEPIPDLYHGKNVARFEQRYMGRLGFQFGVRDFTANLLYDEEIYIEILKRWKQDYLDIEKTKELQLPNFGLIHTNKGFRQYAFLCMVEKFGGEIAMLNLIDEAYKRGDLEYMEAYRRKKEITEVCKIDNWSVPSDAVAELDDKISKAVRHYR